MTLKLYLMKCLERKISVYPSLYIITFTIKLNFKYTCFDYLCLNFTKERGVTIGVR